METQPITLNHRQAVEDLRRKYGHTLSSAGADGAVIAVDTEDVYRALRLAGAFPCGEEALKGGAYANMRTQVHKVERVLGDDNIGDALEVVRQWSHGSHRFGNCDLPGHQWRRIWDSLDYDE